jgi:hypothetical protein
MPNDNSPSRDPDLVGKQIALFQAANEGQLEHLACPRCEQHTVSVWFTHPAPEEYRTWLLCENCDFEARAQNNGRPAFYSNERDRTAKAPA